MSNINISDLEVCHDSTLFTGCTPEEASAIGGGFWTEILGAIGGFGGAGRVLAGLYIGALIDGYL